MCRVNIRLSQGQCQCQCQDRRPCSDNRKRKWNSKTRVDLEQQTTWLLLLLILILRHSQIMTPPPPSTRSAQGVVGNELPIETSTTGVVVLAGTNRADVLDQALRRPGRFDRQITVDKPDLKGRQDIFKVHLKGITLDGDGGVESFAGGRLSGLTPGFAGADIANICNEAAIVAARRNSETVTLDDFDQAIDRVVGGLASHKIMSKDERSIVAYHEAGHTVTGWFLEHADPLMKATIILRSDGALGFAQYLPKGVFLRTQSQIRDNVCMALAGRAAGEIFFGRVTTSASDRCQHRLSEQENPYRPFLLVILLLSNMQYNRTLKNTYLLKLIVWLGALAVNIYQWRCSNIILFHTIVLLKTEDSKDEMK
jgi:hypothetical protein